MRNPPVSRRVGAAPFMSTAAINPKGARQYPQSAGPTAWLSAYLGSTVGQKILVALTGMILVSFVVFHMIGNLKVKVRTTREDPARRIRTETN